MKKYFSKRHEKALNEKRFEVSLLTRLRVAMLRVLSNYSQHGGYDNRENFTFQTAEEKLKTFYGEDTLRAYDSKGNLAPADFEQVIRKGYPVVALDAIEAWFDSAEVDSQPACEKELNDILEIHNSNWRIINKTFVLLDSGYVRDEIITKTEKLLRENSIVGALEEFKESLTALTNGDFKDAVVNAHKSVESVMKAVLKIDKHLTFGKLLENVIKAGIVPKYYEEFLVHFEKLALGAVKERNQPGAGHGQGVQTKQIPKSLAEFAVHLAAVINLFLVNHSLDMKTKDEQPEEIKWDE